ncbi:MAG: hypothetical protein NXI20_07775 [bacterium]|nr:hypothetical protein [bacterium]
MSQDIFNKLNLHQRIKTLYVDGQFVTAIRYYKYKINLYLLENYYVEVFYHHCDDRIEKVEILEDKSTRMKFYIDQIKLPLEFF